MSDNGSSSVQHGGTSEQNLTRAQLNQRAWTNRWLNNKGIFLIVMAQATGSSMDAIARLLQQGEHSMHPFQVIFARMATTFILSIIYMWRTKVPDFPFGDSGVRYWLIARALFGFFGLFCLYYSVHYLPLAEATVLRFLVPIATAWLCSVFLGLKFTRREFVAGLVALVGVILIAHPKAIFGNAENHADTNMSGAVDDVNSTQHIIAVVVSLLGVFGASGAYTMIRVIGDRAHALISVSYFAMISTVGSTTALLIIPGIRFTMPQDALEWILLILLGVLGFVLQFLLTVGLQLDKSSKATSMLYTQVLFAIMFDWTIWNVFPDSWSLFGGAIVIASTLWSALQKPHKIVQDGIKTLPVDEESALLGSQTEESEEVVQSRASTHT